MKTFKYIAVVMLLAGIASLAQAANIKLVGSPLKQPQIKLTKLTFDVDNFKKNYIKVDKRVPGRTIEITIPKDAKTFKLEGEGSEGTGPKHNKWVLKVGKTLNDATDIIPLTEDATYVVWTWGHGTLGSWCANSEGEMCQTFKFTQEEPDNNDMTK